MTRSLLAIFALLIAACHDSSAPVAFNPLGQRFQIVGEAAGGDAAGRTASCELHLIMEMGGESRPAAGAVEFPGSSGFGFFADV
jgi:hypothetical protein